MIKCPMATIIHGIYPDNLLFVKRRESMCMHVLGNNLDYFIKILKVRLFFY